MSACLDASNMTDEESDTYHSLEDQNESSNSDENSLEKMDDSESDSNDDVQNNIKNSDSDESSDNEISDDKEHNEVERIDAEGNDESSDIEANDIEDGSDEESSNDASNEENVNDSDNEMGVDYANAGWADAMAKILSTKKPKKKSSLVLSKAKKITTVKKIKDKSIDFEIVDDKKNISKDAQIIKEEIDEDEPKIKKRREEAPDLRVKPNILERGREKILSKIATRGVVQLFNAVRQQQKDIETKLEKVGPLERKKEKVVKSLDKHKFLDMLMGQTKSEIVNKELLKNETKKEVKEEESKWSVFRNDFMSSSKLKDWDKKEKDSSENEDSSESNDSDSE